MHRAPPRAAPNIHGKLRRSEAGKDTVHVNYVLDMVFLLTAFSHMFFTTFALP